MHRAFLERCAKELAAHVPPPRGERPRYGAAVYASQLEDALGELSRTYGKAVRELVVAPLVKRIEELEARPAFDYCGV